MSDTASSLQYLLACSEASLESFELARLNRASNLRKQLSQVAEEWVDAVASFRLARLIVDRRRADPHTVDPQSSQPATLSPHNQFALQLPFPCEPAAVNTKNEFVATRLKSPAKRVSKENSALARYTGQCSGTNKRRRAAKRVPRSKACDISQAPEIPFSSVADVGHVRTPGAVKSVQAATELRALHVIASGPPEMHSSPPEVIGRSLLRFRFGFRTDLPKLP